MRTFVILCLFGLLGAGIWYWHRNPNELSSISPDILPSFLRPDPARARAMNRMPDGTRLISLVEKVKTYRDLSSAIRSIEMELNETNAMVAVAETVDKKVLASCNGNIDRALDRLSSANERGKRLKSALAEIGSWLRRTVHFIQRTHPARTSAATLLYDDFERQRNEIEQSIKTIQTLSEAIPRLRNSNCEPFEIPPFRESGN